LLVTARYFPYMGGIETHTYEVARRLRRARADVTVLTTDPSGQLPADEEIEGVRVRRVKAWPSNRDYYFAPGVARVIAQDRWDVIHCQGLHTFVPPLAMLAAQRTGTPYVVTFHTGGHSSRLRNAMRGVQFAALRPMLARAERFVGVSQYEVEFFRDRLGLPGERFAFIPNGSDLPQLSEPAKVEPGLIISVGRLERYKGHQRVIAALPHLRRRCPEAHLLILGGGPYEGELRQLALRLDVGRHVQFKTIPPQERGRMAQTLAQASLVVLLSEAESHPVAVMEALLLGRPVLVADTSGLRELARRRLVRAIPLDSTPGQAAVALADQLWHPFTPAGVKLPTWDDCAADLLALYRAVVAGRARYLR
jgi:glycosyltransferase involved in cell wall biosynthesis